MGGGAKRNFGGLSMSRSKSAENALAKIGPRRTPQRPRRDPRGLPRGRGPFLGDLFFGGSEFNSPVL